MSSNIRPRGTVEVPCAACDAPDLQCPACTFPADWGDGQTYFWVDALDPRLPDGPFVCSDCASGRKKHMGCGRALVIEGCQRRQCECPPGCSHTYTQAEFDAVLAMARA